MLVSIKGIYFENDFTITAWVYLNSDSFKLHCPRLIDFGTYIQDNVVVSTGDRNGYVLFYTLNGYASSELIAREELQLNVWTHLAVSSKNAYGIIYYNGREVGSGYLNKLLTKKKRETNYIGRSNWNGNPPANGNFFLISN